jgi:DNA processing protein
MISTRYPSWAYTAALASLPLITPLRLRRLMALGEPSRVWEMLQEGERPLVGVTNDVWRAWHGVSGSHVVQVAEACIDNAMTVVSMNDAAYPSMLLGDPDAPAVLFMIGDARVLSRRRVGIIGTRSATQRGKFFARHIGEELAANDICVVSGLARGIDVEAHVGAMAIPRDEGCGPVAVVASGLDVVYPSEHKRIWGEVGRRGLLVSEAPPGTSPQPHRFPMRNRVLAGLSEVLIVVESRASGGSMITVREAMKRDITVMAVPGFPGVPPSEGTNSLLRDGCAPVTDVADILLALGLDTRHMVEWCDHRVTPHREERQILAVMGRGPRSLDEIALLSGFTVVHTAVLLGRLEATGWVGDSNGWWEALIR